jgi:hypothetical protein
MKRFLVVLLLAMFFSPAFSQEINDAASSGSAMWQKNGIVVSDSQGRSIRQNGRIACLNNTSFIVVWEDQRNGYSDIYAQRIDVSGAKLWGEGGIAVCKATKNQTFPQVVSVGSNEVIVAWQDYRNDTADIYAQKLNIKGIAQWDDDGVPICKAQANQVAPQLAPDGSGGAFITWYDYRSGRGEDIYAQRIDANGVHAWQMDGIPVCAENGTQWYPQIVSDGQNGVVICWDDKRSGYYDVYAQRMDGAGNYLWQMNGIAVSAAPENQEYSQIAMCGKDSFILTWQDYRNGNADIYAQKIDLTGRVLWKNNGEVVCNVAGNQERPQLVGGDAPIIIWTDFRNGTGNSDIYAAKISADGKPLWGPYGVALCEASGNQGNPKATSDGDNGATVVWQDERSGQSGIYARRVNKDGKALWAPDGKTICSSNFSAEFPQVSTICNGNSVIVWQDKRNGGLDVYAQSLNLNGVNVWKTNGIDIVTGYGSVTQQKPKIVKSGKDEYVIAFEDYRNGYSNIYSQKINNKGKIIWNREAVRVCSALGDQFNPEMVTDDMGGAIVVWEDYRNKKSLIYAQKLDPFGTKLWDENGILICQVEGEKLNPKICKDGKGGAILAWQESRTDNNALKVYCQRIDKDGAILWKPEGMSLTTSSNVQTNLKITQDGEGGAVVTWVEYKGNTNTPDIFAQRINENGVVVWGLKALAVCKAPEAQRNPDINSNGEFIIVWEDSGGGNYDIYAQKVNKDGSISWACDGIPVCVAPFTQHEPKLILTGDGGATVVWEDYRKANWDIFAQSLDPKGDLKWEKDGVPVCQARGTQYAPQIVKGDNSSSIIVWEDYRNDKSYGIFSQKLSVDGKALWGKDGLAVCVTDGGARNPQVVDDGIGGAIIVWTDYRYGSYDIFAQRVNEDQIK